MARIFVVCIASLFFVLNLYFIRRNLLEVRYVYLWFLLSILLVVFSVTPSLSIRMQKFLGFELLSNLLFTLAIFVILVFLLFLTVALSGHSRKIRILSQEIALLRMKSNSVNHEDRLHPSE